MEQFGAGSRTKGVEALPESALKFVGTHQVGLRRLLANGVDSVFEDVARSRLPMAEMLGTCSDWSPPERRYADGEGEQEVERGTTRFEATLWAAADKLRGHMDAAEYMHFSLLGR